MNNLFSSLHVATQDTTSLKGETTQKVNAFSRYLQNIDWDKILAAVIGKIALLVILCVLLLIVQKVGTKIIKTSFDNYQKKQHFSENRINTLYTLSKNIFHYTLFFVFLYSLLTIIGIPVGSLIAGAGIVGIAIGLGAQGFINDIITGFFIILERQLDIGDTVKIGPIEGTVLAVGLRTTQLKSADGTVHFLPNRTISIISNLSRANMRALIDVRIQAEEDQQKVRTILEKVNQQLVPSHPEIQSGPDILGIVDLGSGHFAIRVVMYTLNGSQYKIQREFLSAYITALQNEGVQLPQSSIQLNI